MEPIWQANGWDGMAPVTRHEARLRREALRALGVPASHLAEVDDPWQVLEHLQDLFGYVVGRPATLAPATDCPPEVDVAWAAAGRPAAQRNQSVTLANRSDLGCRPGSFVYWRFCRGKKADPSRGALRSRGTTGSRLLRLARESDCSCTPRPQALEPPIRNEGAASGL
jgi:hypothetical protein